MTPDPKTLIDPSLALARLMLQFARTNRAVHMEDGVTLESDTDHTTMLGVMATAFAATYVPRLDLGRVAQFSLVHDLVEVYASDTPTFRAMSAEDVKEKEDREHAALLRIKQEFDASYPWIGQTIEAYERLDTPEARFVKLYDKLLPKFVHILHEGATARSLGHTKESAAEFHTDQYTKIQSSYGADQAEALALLASLIDYMDEIEDTLFPPQEASPALAHE